MPPGLAEEELQGVGGRLGDRRDGCGLLRRLRPARRRGSRSRGGRSSGRARPARARRARARRRPRRSSVVFTDPACSAASSSCWRSSVRRRCSMSTVDMQRAGCTRDSLVAKPACPVATAFVHEKRRYVKLAREASAPSRRRSRRRQRLPRRAARRTAARRSAPSRGEPMPPVAASARPEPSAAATRGSADAISNQPSTCEVSASTTSHTNDSQEVASSSSPRSHPTGSVTSAEASVAWKSAPAERARPRSSRAAPAGSRRTRPRSGSRRARRAPDRRRRHPRRRRRR